jgi:hypothetical protein
MMAGWITGHRICQAGPQIQERKKDWTIGLPSSKISPSAELAHFFLPRSGIFFFMEQRI